MASEKERVLELVKELSIRLDTGLSPPALEAIVDLLQQGVSPDAIVAVIQSCSS